MDDVDRLCFECPLPDCNESSPDCLRRQAIDRMRAQHLQMVLCHLDQDRYITASDLARFSGLDLPYVIGSLRTLRRQGIVRSVKVPGARAHYWGLA